jgi:heptosyltransferase-1
MHLAAALAVPVVALFGPTDPTRNGPFSLNSIVLRSDASETNTSHHAKPDAGLLLITAAEVIAAARQLAGPAREVTR